LVGDLGPQVITYQCLENVRTLVAS
jgi:hypothetical protein